jgi:hypothetical protein
MHLLGELFALERSALARVEEGEVDGDEVGVVVEGLIEEGLTDGAECPFGILGTTLAGGDLSFDPGEPELGKWIGKFLVQITGLSELGKDAQNDSF